ncbi:MAG: prepilin-type N-terminal cleavage/methylation domain-containing protein [Proteobacteria bacterium]|jgi:type IV pilus assembly protein PilE|nr:prepilin-type N-terminal cleavage/methylation domain-containing protein [Pseudomonadota bacterium]
MGGGSVLQQPGAGRRGFTLIELMIAVAVVAIIAAVALPSYQSSMRKSRRSEAFAALAVVQQMQERHRSSQPTYAASLTDAPSASPAGLGMTGTRTASGYYDLSVSGTDGRGYTLMAVGVDGTSQANDDKCRALAVRLQDGNLRHAGAAAAAAIDWTLADPDPARCWAR